MIPMKTTIGDLESLLGYLRANVGWVPTSKVKSALEKAGDNRKIEAAKWLGLLERDGNNIQISGDGRVWVSSDSPAEKQQILRKLIGQNPLYSETMEWIHHTKQVDPKKTDIADKWHRNHTELLEGAKNQALGDAVITFMRVAEAAGFGKYIGAGNGRPESYLKTDASSIEEFVKSLQNRDTPDILNSEAVNSGLSRVSSPAIISDNIVEAHSGNIPLKQKDVVVNTSPAVHINVEIHIAADATAETVAEIFKNMRKYVLDK